MEEALRILVTGAPGAGSSTLGQALAKEYCCEFLETDNYYWLPTEPPFSHPREASDRTLLFVEAMRATEHVVVAGSVGDWGSEIEHAFDLIVFLFLQRSTRIERIQHREAMRGAKASPEFLEFAEKYDQAPLESIGRNLAKQIKWLGSRQCSVLRIEGDFTVAERLAKVLDLCSSTQFRRTPSRPILVSSFTDGASP